MSEEAEEDAAVGSEAQESEQLSDTEAAVFPIRLWRLRHCHSGTPLSILQGAEESIEHIENSGAPRRLASGKGFPQTSNLENSRSWTSL